MVRYFHVSCRECESKASFLSVSHFLPPGPIPPLHLLSEHRVKRALSRSPIAIECDTKLATCADPSPVTNEDGAAEEIFLQGEAVKTPAFGGGIDTREIGLFGKETKLSEGRDGAF